MTCVFVIITSEYYFLLQVISPFFSLHLNITIINKDMNFTNISEIHLNIVSFGHFNV